MAQSSGNWDLFERCGSLTAAIGLVVASRRYFQYGVHELAMLRAHDELKSEMAELLEDVLTAKMGLALSAFGTNRLGLGQIPRVVELQLPAGVGLVRLSRCLSGFYSGKEEALRRGLIRYFPKWMRSLPPRLLAPLVCSKPLFGGPRAPIANRRNSETILKQPAEMRRTVEAV